MTQHTERQSVNQRIVLVSRVEDEFPAHVGYTERIAVVRKTGSCSFEDACSVGVIDLANTQLVHDSDRAGAHGNNVAHNTADSSCGSLVGLEVNGTFVHYNYDYYVLVIDYVKLCIV